MYSILNRPAQGFGSCHGDEVLSRDTQGRAGCSFLLSSHCNRPALRFSLLADAGPLGFSLSPASYHWGMAKPARIMTDDGTGYWECDGCGACCRSLSIFVSERDARREPRIAIEGKRLPLHLADGPWEIRLFPLPFLDSCPFLDGMDRCEIYDSRPEVCRMLEAGDSQCQESRRRQGMEELKPISWTAGGPTSQDCMES